MATSTAQAIATVPVWDYLMNPGDPTTTTPKGLGGKKGKITLTYSLSQSANPVTLLGTDPIPFTTDPNGFWQVNLVPNNKISPTGTLYNVEIEGYRSYLILVTDANVPGIGWQSAAIAILPPIGGGAPGYTLPAGTTVLGDFFANGSGIFQGPSPDYNARHASWAGGADEAVLDNGPALNAAIAAAAAIGGGRVILRARTTGIFPVQTSVRMAENVTLDLTGCQLKWTGAINSIMLQGPAVYAPITRVRLVAIDLDCNNIAGVTGWLLNSWSNGWYQVIARNVSGAGIPAMRIEASTGNIVGFPNPLFQNTVNNEFATLIVISAPYGIKLSGYQPGGFGNTTYGVVTLNSFTNIKCFQITQVGVDVVQNTDTNGFISVYVQLFAINSIAILFNDTATPAADMDAKLNEFLAVGVDLQPLTLTGCNAIKFNWSAGNQIFALNTNPIASAWPGGAAVRINDVFGHSYQILDVASIPGVMTYKDSTINLIGQSQLQRSRQTVAFSASITIDASLGEHVTISGTVNAAFTVNAPTNPLVGQLLLLTFTKDATGAQYLATWNGVFKGNPQLGTDANTVQTFVWYFDGANWQTYAINLQDQAGSTWAPAKFTAQGYIGTTASLYYGLGGTQTTFDTLSGSGSHRWTNNNQGTVLGTLTSTGQFESRFQIYPGAEAGGLQTAGGILHSTGVPSNANGNNNDWCISDNGSQYFRRSGVWQNMTVATNAQSTPANPALTASLVGVMMGLAGAITPVRTGNVLITISGDMFNSVVADGVTAQIRTGTGAAPGNGTALAGTIRGNPVAYTAAVASTKSPFSITVVATGLTLGTAIWIDLGVAAVTGGNASVENITITAVEV